MQALAARRAGLPSPPLRRRRRPRGRDPHRPAVCASQQRHVFHDVCLAKEGTGAGEASRGRRQRPEGQGWGCGLRAAGRHGEGETPHDSRSGWLAKKPASPDATNHAFKGFGERPRKDGLQRRSLSDASPGDCTTMDARSTAPTSLPLRRGSSGLRTQHTPGHGESGRAVRTAAGPGGQCAHGRRRRNAGPLTLRGRRGRRRHLPCNGHASLGWRDPANLADAGQEVAGGRRRHLSQPGTAAAGQAPGRPAEGRGEPRRRARGSTWERAGRRAPLCRRRFRRLLIRPCPPQHPREPAEARRRLTAAPPGVSDGASYTAQSAPHVP